MSNRTVFRHGALPEGALLAGYRIKEQAGHGGMAIVYRAHDLRLDRWVALKVLSAEAAADSDFRRRFIRESRAAAAVDHPHIIPIHEAGEAAGVLYIAMRFAEGGDLSTLLRKHHVLPLNRVCNIVAQVAAALDAAHSHGLVHRDVKPANILLGAWTAHERADHVYLTDFGVTHRPPLAHRPDGVVEAAEFVGTPPYVAPEQVEGRHVDGRTDLYALACTAYQMLCGAPPFHHGDSKAVLWAQAYEPPPMLTTQRPDLPDAMDGVFAKALAKSRRERYTTCLDFATVLHRASGLEDRPRAASVASGPPGHAAAGQSHGFATRTELTSPVDRWSAGAGPAPRQACDRGAPAGARRPVPKNLPLVIVALMVAATIAGVAALTVKRHALAVTRHARHPAGQRLHRVVAAFYTGGDAGPGCPAAAGASAATATGAGGDGWIQVGGGPPACHGQALASRKTGQVAAVQDTFGWTVDIGHPATCAAAIFIADVNPSSGTAHYEVFAAGRPPHPPIATFDILQGQAKGTWVAEGPWHVRTGVLQVSLTDQAAFPGDINHVTASAARATCR